MKSCYKCKAEKPFSEFYKDKKSQDGKECTCKECRRESQRESYKFRMKDPEWAENERLRAREKYHTFNYKDRYKPSKEYEYKRKVSYYEKYPEKLTAKNLIKSSHYK